MNKSTILDKSNIPPLFSRSSSEVDIDTIIHKCVYDLSQSGFSSKFETSDLQTRFFLDAIYPVAIKKVSAKLNSFDEWKELRTLMRPAEKSICDYREIFLNFQAANHKVSELGKKQKSILNGRINALMDNNHDVLRAVVNRYLAIYALRNETSFREEFLIDETFEKGHGRINFSKILQEKYPHIAKYREWKSEKINELSINLSDQDFFKTMVKGFADFRSKLQIDFDSPVYGVRFMADYMPEIMSRLSTNNNSDWQEEIIKIRLLHREQKELLSKMTELSSQILRYESQWRPDSDICTQLLRINDQKNINPSKEGFSL